MFVAAKAAAEIAACAVVAASPVIRVSIRSAVAAAVIEEILLASLAGMMILLSLPSSLHSLYLTSPESWPTPLGEAVYYSGRPPSAVMQEAVVAVVTPPQVAATEATQQLQDGRRSVLGGYLSDHLRPVSRKSRKKNIVNELVYAN